MTYLRPEAFAARSGELLMSVSRRTLGIIQGKAQLEANSAV